MKFAVAFCVFFLTALALARPDHYTDKHDNVDVKEILENSRLFEIHMKCMMDEGKCTAEGKELKDHIPEALSTGCSKCTEVQKEKTRIVLSHLINKDPANWKRLCGKYDPENKYAAKYEKELRELEG